MKRIAAALLDLDGTLYSPDSRFAQRIDGNITDFIADRLGLPEAEADAMRVRYWREYGATVRGLHLRHGIAYEDYHQAICGFDFGDYITPDQRVARALGALRCLRVLFTNAPLAYIERMLATLELEGLFGRIYPLEFRDHQTKPDPSLYGSVVADLGVPADQCLMVDDQAMNLAPARDLGMVTVLVGGEAGAGADHQISHLAELPPLLQQHYDVVPAEDCH
ncbi:MAG: HAD-IA family hydrolase [Armatimonadota bacterium]